MCDDDCPHCGFRHMTPFGSTDLGTLVAQDGDAFIVLRSSDDAEHDPDYGEIGRFPTRAAAEVFAGQPEHPS